MRPEGLNVNGTLFGGSLLRWVDEEATICAAPQFGKGRVVTKPRCGLRRACGRRRARAGFIRAAEALMTICWGELDAG